MKNFNNYTPEKYATANYQKIEDGIYLVKGEYSDDSNNNDSNNNNHTFVTSLSFEMEPECYGEEGGSPQNITQVPLEDLLDEFFVYVSDFYESENEKSAVTCFQEFASSDLEDVRRLRTVIGKRVYAVPYIDENDGEEYYNMAVELDTNN